MRKFTVWVVPPVLALLSCGTSKKLEKAMADNAQLQSQVTALNQKVTTYEADITRLKEENLQYGKEAQECREVQAAIERNLQQMNDALAANSSTFRKIRDRAEADLEQLGNAGATVTYDQGLVRISMNDRLLFKSGSAVLSKDGIDALQVIANILNEYPKLKTYVVGNTDDVSVRSGFKDNWSLSTERANSIVRILRDKYQVDPSRLVSGGMGKYNPVADNSTPEGKALNRRTDFVLNPDFSRLWEVAQEQQ
ncbi:OmpA/MotB family protein [Flavihumibacter petaseus]|uniref:OmpA family protein n=1 Tax=Flavihumibacter petaseus NBRC 106054 TaxID=1220578 RepID=A0A0E9MYL4_9BACT|nr:flagellar motor protein MotB [Flavihumibacter petaseus]GAO42598.1 OmpA family protein [Flavihumibacter petaseus NBRC 106054]